MKEVFRMANIALTRLTDDDREQFILDNQRAFKYGAKNIAETSCKHGCYRLPEHWGFPENLASVLLRKFLKF